MGSFAIAYCFFEVLGSQIIISCGIADSQYPFSDNLFSSWAKIKPDLNFSSQQ
jgi:hypothetical protein